MRLQKLRKRLASASSMWPGDVIQALLGDPPGDPYSLPEGSPSPGLGTQLIVRTSRCPPHSAQLSLPLSHYPDGTQGRTYTQDKNTLTRIQRGDA